MFLLRLALKTIAFAYVLPMIAGIDMHGNLWNAFVLGVIFTLLSGVVSILLAFFSAALTISTLGLALLFLIPMWLLGFWIVPTITLKLISDMMPHYLAISGWWPAIWGGLIMFFIGVLTDSPKTRIRRIRHIDE
jgi:uncharacterized membrane protein YvlD (DUF360 family)